MTSSTANIPAPPAPPPPKKSSGPTRKFEISRGVRAAAQRIGIYGPGGIGKTTLVSHMTQAGVTPVVIDLDRGSYGLDVQRIDGIDTFQDIRDALHTLDLFPEGSAVVLDSTTAAEILAVKHTLEHVKHEKGHRVESIEGYGFGKGFQHVYDTFMLLLGDLDGLYRKGRHVVLVMHECVSTVPNPTGEDWIRYEPRLQSPSSGKASVRHAVKEWLDHLLFVGYDVVANSDGKGQGKGTRTIYPQELPTHWAKSRKLRDPIVYHEGDASVWRSLF